MLNYKYNFKNGCFKDCPINYEKRKNAKELEGFEKDAEYFCKPICTEESPYEIISK